MYWETLALHVRRGLAGVIRESRHAGGRAYGYRLTSERGVLEINEDGAAIVREIFARYGENESPRERSHRTQQASH